MDHNRSDPDDGNGFQLASARLILDSHRRLTGKALPVDERDIGRGLYEAPFVVLAHDTAADPVFFYANRQAQRLFEMGWDEMVNLPSRCSTEPLVREERQRLLDRVSRYGYIDDYSGVRISKSGARFRIERATVWNLIDEGGRRIGQAAAFDDWATIG